MRGMTLSLLSGFLAALASLCGKFSMASGETASVCQVVFSHWVSGPSAHYVCGNVSFVFSMSNKVKVLKQTFLYSTLQLITVIRVVFFFLMIACNAVMWTIFTKALRLCTTTLEAAATNTASNFFFTAVFGQTLFGEQLTLLWWLGTVMILFGLLLMHQANVETKASHTVRGLVRQKIS
ncbi:uncharacterized protein LOC142591680 isoform X1 [Dermacentor variabilis]|uniref:uncharacterized protein LOC142591680 isoform X1 n=1 Tax=Dermacentor variabilis TaxID=34621 RepID=UPI003F5C41B2